MDILSDWYYKSVSENEKNLRFWDGYLQNLKSIDFKSNSEKLKVPVLVPIGSRILFRGELKHTNEVTVALGADYFVKCSFSQADIIRQHRIKVVQEKVDAYHKESEYLQNQMSFRKQNVYDDQGQEIIEHHTEEEDKAWREKHRANVREYMQNKAKEKREKESDRTDDKTDEELWDRLEELELQEELMDEYSNEDNTSSFKEEVENKKEPLVIKKEDIITALEKSDENFEVKDIDKAKKEVRNKKVTFEPKQTSTINLLQQVIDKQNELDEKLHEIKNRERSQSKTEEDLIARLDEMDQLDELEDEMDRLDDIIEYENIEEIEDVEHPEVEINKPNTSSPKMRVTFIDQDDSETLHLTFKHSETEPSNEPYDPEKGIQKPSDLYKMHSNLFNGTTSILKKSKYDGTNELEVDSYTAHPTNRKRDGKNKVGQENKKLQFTTKGTSLNNEPNKSSNSIQNISADKSNSDDYIPHQTIVVKDVVENIQQVDKKFLPTETKPISLFKKKRMANKSS